MLIRRMRVYPGINWKTETTVDVYIDKVVDLTCHPLYSSLLNPSNSRSRGRSVPTHRLNVDLAEGLSLEVDSMVEPARDPANETGMIELLLFVLVVLID